MGGGHSDIFPFQSRKVGTRSLYRQKCCQLRIRCSGIDSGPSIVDLLFGFDLLFRSRVHENGRGAAGVTKIGGAANKGSRIFGCCPRPQVLWLEWKKGLGGPVLPMV